MDLKRYILQGMYEDKNELLRKNRRLIVLRWIYLSILGAIAVGVPYLVQAPTVTVVQHAVIFGSGLLLNTFLYFANNVRDKSITYYNAISFLQILIDLGVATGGVAIQGGVYSRAIILYVLPILGTGLLLMSTSLVYITALLSAVAYDTTIVAAMLLGDAEEILPHVGGPFLFYPVLFFIIARIVVYLNEYNLQNTQEETQEELMAMLTHKLRHPSSVIRAIIDTMEGNQEVKSNSELARYLDMIKTENTRGIHLVNNILKAAEPLSATSEKEIELVGLIKGAAINKGEENKRTDDIIFHVPEEVEVRTDTDRLHVILENVLDNALRYSQAGSPIEITVTEEGSEIKISVSDHGVGMDEQQRKTVFDKFGHTTTPKGQVEGAGLGMYLVKKLTEAGGGRVSVDSLPDEGTRVTIFLKKG